MLHTVNVAWSASPALRDLFRPRPNVVGDNLFAVDENLEGWCTDPYGRHEARWMSDSKPTKLVRDAGVESYDEPPDEPPKRVAERIQDEAKSDGKDLRRADDAVRGDTYDPHRAARAALDVFDESQP